MKLKKFITIFCLLVLSIQMLPVKQIGYVLFSNQITEELPHSIDAKVKSCLAKEYPCVEAYASSLLVIASNDKAYFHFAVSLPVPHTGDIQTPPPNIA